MIKFFVGTFRTVSAAFNKSAQRSSSEIEVPFSLYSKAAMSMKWPSVISTFMLFSHEIWFQYYTRIGFPSGKIKKFCR